MTNVGLKNFAQAIAYLPNLEQLNVSLAQYLQNVSI